MRLFHTLFALGLHYIFVLHKSRAQTSSNINNLRSQRTHKRQRMPDKDEDVFHTHKASRLAWPQITRIRPDVRLWPALLFWQLSMYAANWGRIGAQAQFRPEDVLLCIDGQAKAAGKLINENCNAIFLRLEAHSPPPSTPPLHYISRTIGT